jgi:sugar-specific transcriptional regulator TrmB
LSSYDEAMNGQELISHVEELGLSNKEARIYVAALSLGPSPVQVIADQSGIKRVTTYVILESLVGLGLVSQTIKGKKTYFIAEDPVNLERLIDKRERELRDQKTSFTRILPALKGLKSLPKDSPIVKFYDGADSIKSILNTFIQKTREPNVVEVYGFSNIDLVLRFFPEFRATTSNPWRSKAGVHSMFLYSSLEGPIMKESDAAQNRESRWIPPEKFPAVGDFTIIDDTILMLSLGAARPVGITIESKELAAGLRVVFSVAWEGAAKYN